LEYASSISLLLMVHSQSDSLPAHTSMASNSVFLPSYSLELPEDIAASYITNVIGGCRSLGCIWRHKLVDSSSVQLEVVNSTGICCLCGTCDSRFRATSSEFCHRNPKFGNVFYVSWTHCTTSMQGASAPEVCADKNDTSQ
jgi:hypothetical protein